MLAFGVLAAGAAVGARKLVRRRQRAGKMRVLSIDLPVPSAYLPKPPKPTDYVPPDRLGSNDF